MGLFRNEQSSRAKDSIDKDSIDKDSIDKDSIDKDSIDKDSIQNAIDLLNFYRLKVMLRVFLILCLLFPIVNYYIFKDKELSSLAVSFFISDAILFLNVIIYFFILKKIPKPSQPSGLKPSHKILINYFLFIALTWATFEAILEITYSKQFTIAIILIVALSTIPYLSLKASLFWFGIFLAIFTTVLFFENEKTGLFPLKLMNIAGLFIIGWTVSRLLYNSKIRTIRSEQQLMQSEKRKEEAYAQLKEAQEALIETEKLAIIGKMAAGIVHEINNPLSYIQSNFSALNQFYTKQMSETQEERKVAVDYSELTDIFKDCSDGFERIKQIVSSLRDLANPVEEPAKKADLNNIAASAIKITRSTNNCAITFSPASLPKIKCKPGEIHQVLINLLVNASQAIEAVEKNKGIITVKTWLSKGYVYCCVSDNGPGFDKKTQQKLFQPFYSSKQKGMGLGLNISHKIIVEKHEGKISAQRNKQTEFTFCLPVQSTFLELLQ